MTKIAYRKKGTLILSSLLEDLEVFEQARSQFAAYSVEAAGAACNAGSTRVFQDPGKQRSLLLRNSVRLTVPTGLVAVVLESGLDGLLWIHPCRSLKSIERSLQKTTRGKTE